MKFLLIVSSWLLIAFGFSIYLASKIPEIEFSTISIFLVSIGFIIGLIYYFVLSSFPSNRKTMIFDEIIKDYNGFYNSNGNPEFKINNRKVIVEYDTEMANSQLSEYLIAYIDISDLSYSLKEKCRQEFDVDNIKSIPFIKIYCHWQFQGYTFDDRLKQKLGELEKLINKNVC